MGSRDEGVIKFHCQWRQAPPPTADVVPSLMHFRNLLFCNGLIGVYPDGIGFGNISARAGANRQFVISASQTGHIEVASADHFVKVSAYDVESNSVVCEGPMRASSETLTHAMIYETFPAIEGVIHVHHRQHWQRLKGRVPTSRSDVPYGTPAMAKEVSRLASDEKLGDIKLFVMAGHEDGILSFGHDLQEAYDVLMKTLSTCK